MLAAHKSSAVRLLIASLLIALVVACAKGREIAHGPTHQLRIAGEGELTGLNPHVNSGAALPYISQLTQAYLVKYDSQNRPYPELLTAIPTQRNGGVSPDGKSITWHLRKGLRWSDGAAFDADDVVFSIHVVQNPKNNEVSDAWSLINGISEPDKHTVIIHLAKPYASFLPTFFSSAGLTSVLPKHILAGYPDINNVPYNDRPVGIGPFRVVTWRHDEYVDLEANPYYFRGMPKLARVRFTLIPSRDTIVSQLQTGEIDLWPQIPPEYIPAVKAIRSVRTEVSPGLAVGQLTLNVSRPPLDDLRVRRAIRYAIDRRRIVEKLNRGYGILQESIISPAIPGAPTDVPLTPYDPVRAAALLNAAGWHVGSDGFRSKNGRRLTLDFPYFKGGALVDDTVELIRENLKAVGIEVQTRKPADFFDPAGTLAKGAFDVTWYGFQSDPIGDVSLTLRCDQIPPRGANFGRFCDRRADKLFERFERTYDDKTRQRLLERESTIIEEDVPMIVLYAWTQAYAYNPRISGFQPGIGLTPFDNVMDVDV